jgi:hypothetical protein
MMNGNLLIFFDWLIDCFQFFVVKKERDNISIWLITGGRKDENRLIDWLINWLIDWLIAGRRQDWLGPQNSCRRKNRLEVYQQFLQKSNTAIFALA